MHWQSAGEIVADCTLNSTACYCTPSDRHCSRHEALPFSSRNLLRMRLHSVRLHSSTMWCSSADTICSIYTYAVVSNVYARPITCYWHQAKFEAIAGVQHRHCQICRSMGATRLIQSVSEMKQSTMYTAGVCTKSLHQFLSSEQTYHCTCSSASMPERNNHTLWPANKSGCMVECQDPNNPGT